MLLKGNVLGCHWPQRRSQSHTGAPDCSSSDLDEHATEQPSVITRYNTPPDVACEQCEETRVSFDFFAAAGLRHGPKPARPVHDPRLCVVTAVLPRATRRVALPRRAETDFYGNIPSLSAQNSPRTASQRRSIAHSAKVVIFACAQPALFVRWSAYFAHRAPLAAYNILARYPLARCAARGWKRPAAARARVFAAARKPRNWTCNLIASGRRRRRRRIRSPSAVVLVSTAPHLARPPVVPAEHSMDARFARRTRRLSYGARCAGPR